MERPRPHASGGVVTFLDVLGWRGIYQRKEDPLGDLSTLVRELEEMAEDEPAPGCETQIRSISDTIAVFSSAEEAAWDQGLELHGQLAAWAIARGMIYQMPVRGATSVGQFQLSANIFVGPAIDEAAGWYEKADWIGVHLTPSAAFAFEPKDSSMWVPYAPPVAGAIGWTCPCVLWPDAWLFSDENRQSLLRIFRQMGPITPDISSKYTNALRFFDETQSRVKRVS